MSAQPVDLLAEVESLTNPFPGLRPFEAHESYLFFGRDGQSEELIDKLSLTHFVAVVGTSGSGKSSLVRAGLLPSLRGGLMTKAGSDWRIAIMRPGNDPIENLARALNAVDVFGSPDKDQNTLQIALSEATLRRGNRGLVEIVSQNEMPRGGNLLVVVDQFEELFRFQREAARQLPNERSRYLNDAAAFVKLLLEAYRQKSNIYVVLTMRSDYLGDCSQFWGLPEAINESQYLVPRLSRDQLREAITGPVAVGGGEISTRLASRLLNDVGDNQDQLPVLQHLLMRVWDEWKEKRLKIGTRTHQQVHQGAAIDLCCYEAVGGMAEALSRHADEACNELPDERHREVAEKAFKALTEKGPDNREIRRPITVGGICAVVRATESEVVTVVEIFRQPGRSFLMPAVGEALNSESLIDISHESLIRGWVQLKKWVEEEAESVSKYCRLVETATLHQQKKAGLWGAPDLQDTLDWKKKNDPNEEWAARYYPGFETAIEFLRASEEKRDRETADAERRQREEVDRAKRELEQAKALAEAQEQRANAERQKVGEQRQRLEDQSKASARLRRWLVASVVSGSLAFLFFALALFSLVQAKVAANLAIAATNAAIKEEEAAQRLRYVANMSLAHQNLLTGNLARVVQLLSVDLPGSANRNDLRSFVWYYLWRKGHKEQATLRGHSGAVAAVVFSPDGKILASAGDDRTVKLWDVSTRQELATLSGHSDLVLAIAFSRDGELLASTSEDKTVKLWKVHTRELVDTLKFKGDLLIRSVAFSRDGNIIALACNDNTGNNDNTVKLWNRKEAKELDPLKGHSAGVWTVAFSQDGETLASGSLDKTFKLWNTKEWKPTYTSPAQSSGVYSVAFSPDGKKLALAINDKMVKLFDIASRNLSPPIKEHSDVLSVTFSPDGTLLASSGLDGTVRIRDAATQTVKSTLGGHAHGVLSIAFSPDGKLLASGSYDMDVKLSDSSAWQELPGVIKDSERIYSVAFSPDGKTLASANINKTIKLWNVASREKLAAPLDVGDSNYVRALTFSPNGKTLAAAVSDGTVRLWEVGTWKMMNTLGGNTGVVRSVAFSPDGKLLASGGEDKTVRLWDADTGKAVRVLKANDVVLTVAFSPDGKTLVSAGYDKAVTLWDPGTGQLKYSLPKLVRAVICVAFSPDGKILATGDYYGTVKLWDLAAQQPNTQEALATVFAHSSGVLSVAFSPDGKTFASSGYDNTVKLWDVATRQELATLTENEHSVYSIAFSPDGKMLASGDFDKQLMFWTAATEETVEAQRK